MPESTVKDAPASEPSGPAGGPSIRFAVLPVGEDQDGFGGGQQVCVYVDGVELTSTAAGLGMDPRDLLIRRSGLAAGPQPRTVAIARCGCGVYGCGSTDVTITRDQGLVHWDWLKELPQASSLGAGFPQQPRTSFDAAHYDREAARLQDDHSWETPGASAYRLIASQLPLPALTAQHLSLSSAHTDHRDPAVFHVWLNYRNTHQVFLQLPWAGSTPAELAARVCTLLGGPAASWPARWHTIRTADEDRPPEIAGPGWSVYVPQW